MIPKQTIDQIFETVRIDEVVSEFVQLKKRGVNYIGLCPFHDEKTPSFTVNPTKNIFKCFGCGKGGNSVHFIMEHEHYSYPEALKFLAKKYQIEIEEKEQTAEEIAAMNEHESLLNVSQFAATEFEKLLWENQEGKAIGLSYFKERGFKESTIKKFQLGYSLDQWDYFTNIAQENAYKKEYLIQSGLSTEKEGKVFDRFRARVMFPIQNVTGRVIAFGARVLSAEKSKAKYLNSPESIIYHKGKVLYGICQAKNEIVKKDNCYLVEGYTDVISLHQNGIENVVASSGTSLTSDQIKLIKRYTENITMLYDGDAAGIKASFRGIDMILEEGLNVKIVLFPDGEDPDSFARKKPTNELAAFITENANDFISFKTKLLLKETENDPIKKTKVIKEILQSISVISDVIKRNLYIKECSTLLAIEEKSLITELNKIIRGKFRKDNNYRHSAVVEEKPIAPTQKIFEKDPFHAERELVKVLVLFGKNNMFPYTGKYFQRMREVLEQEDVKFDKSSEINVAEYIIKDLESNGIELRDKYSKIIFDIYRDSIVNKQALPEEKSFINHADNDLSIFVTDLIFSTHTISINWEKRFHVLTNSIENDEVNLTEHIYSVILNVKNFAFERLIKESMNKLKGIVDPNEFNAILQDIKGYESMRLQINNILGVAVRS